MYYYFRDLISKQFRVKSSYFKVLYRMDYQYARYSLSKGCPWICSHQPVKLADWKHKINFIPRQTVLYRGVKLLRLLRGRMNQFQSDHGLESPVKYCNLNNCKIANIYLHKIIY
jgi:hypothetical protein